MAKNLPRDVPQNKLAVGTFVSCGWCLKGSRFLRESEMFAMHYDLARPAFESVGWSVYGVGGSRGWVCAL